MTVGLQVPAFTRMGGTDVEAMLVVVTRGCARGRSLRMRGRSGLSAAGRLGAEQLLGVARGLEAGLGGFDRTIERAAGSMVAHPARSAIERARRARGRLQSGYQGRAHARADGTNGGNRRPRCRTSGG